MWKEKLAGVKVAIVAADGFEQVELTRPKEKLVKEGAEVEVISLRSGSIQGMNVLVPGETVDVDRTVANADPTDYDALLIPGGFVSPDFLRQSEEVLEFVRQFQIEGKPIAAICHGPWVLISAGLVRGRRLTSWPGIQDDVRNAGGIWENKAVVKDGNWISSRGPQDLHAFNKALVEHFSPALVAQERESSVPFATLVGGGLAVAAVGYGIRKVRQNQFSEEADQ